MPWASHSTSPFGRSTPGGTSTMTEPRLPRHARIRARVRKSRTWHTRAMGAGLPALPFGPTPEHRNVGSGYIHLPQALHEGVVASVLHSLAEQGFRRIVVWRGCGQHHLARPTPEAGRRTYRPHSPSRDRGGRLGRPRSGFRAPFIQRCHWRRHTRQPRSGSEGVGDGGGARCADVQRTWAMSVSCSPPPPAHEAGGPLCAPAPNEEG
jgi:hypothetical protein